MQDIENQPPLLQPPSIIGKPPRSGRWKLALVLIILAVLVLGGTLTLLYVTMNGGPAQVDGPVTKTSLQMTAPYAGLDVSLLEVQQAKNFANNPNANQDGILRLNLKAENKTSQAIGFEIEKSVLLRLADGKVVPSNYHLGSALLAAGASLTGSADFPVPVATKPETVTILLGSEQEAQVEVPLSGQPDLKQYATQKVTIANTSDVAYHDLDWKLTGVTQQWQITGLQAQKDMRFYEISLTIRNVPTIQKVIIGSAYDYLHLKLGDQSVAPNASTLPVSISETETEKNGTVIFQAPKDAKELTLVFHTADNNGYDEQTMTIKIQ